MIISRMRSVLTVIVSLTACLSATLAPAQTRPATPTTPAATDGDARVYVSLETSRGEIVLALNETLAPKTVANFLSYVDRKFYDNTIFHRVIAGSMIQGGGYTADLKEKAADKPIVNEWTNGLKNTRGSVAMARKAGEPDSAAAQFFINAIDNRAYDAPQPDGAGYAVFGEVVAGMKVVDDIRMVDVSGKTEGFEALPTEAVVIKTVRVLSQADAEAKVAADKPKRRVPRDPIPERPKPATPAPLPNRKSPTPAPAVDPVTPVDEGNLREYVLMSTSKGDIIIELDREHAPISVANFLSYVDKKAYDGTIFHRVMPGFMIQGGGFTPDMQQKPNDTPIRNEWQNGLKNVRGSVAMARLGGNPNSASNQFFINVVDNAGLDRPQSDGAGYAVFGKVIAGMKTVDAIRVVPTGNRGMHQNVPTDPVIIKSVTRLTEEQAIEGRKTVGE